MNIIANICSTTGKTPLVIAALGDSLTYGWLVNKGYLDFLNEMLCRKYPDLKISIKNHGVPGDTARDGLRRINNLTADNPDLCIIQFALNDAFTGITPDGFRKNIEQIVRKLQSDTSANLLLLTSVPINSPYENRVAESFYNIIIECGVKFDIPVAKVHEYWNKKISSGIKHSSLVQGDGIHPVENGYRLMAEAVMELL